MHLEYNKINVPYDEQYSLLSYIVKKLLPLGGSSPKIKGRLEKIIKLY